ncbi:hypothetical protein LINPERPRIM_LOCUS13014 [Linum perenne]
MFFFNIISKLKLRGQGYDGASNMSGKFNGLKTLFLKVSSYACFVHCFAHRLQLTLVSSAKDCDPIWDFYSILDKVINIVKSSPELNTELQEQHIRHIDAMLESGDIQSTQGANQMTTLKRSVLLVGVLITLLLKATYLCFWQLSK